MFLTRKAYDAALAAEYEKGVIAGERMVTIMREQLSTMTRALDASIAREGERAQDVAKFAAAATFAPTPPVRMPQLLARPPQEDFRRRLEESDPFSEVPIGDPRGSFKEASEASLLPGLDDALRAALGSDVDGRQ